jgi:hypothetical protein
MTEVSLRLAPLALETLLEQRREMPQKNELCGALCAATALRVRGRTAFEGEAVDQDLVAVHAGTALNGDDSESDLPPGEVGRSDYRREFQRVSGPLSGTAAEGVGRAIETISGGRLKVIPVAGPWSEESLRSLLELALTTADAGLIANLAPARLWAPDTDVSEALSYLQHGRDQGLSWGWEVGHFVHIVGLAVGPAAALGAVVDTYPSIGDNGLHMQPLSRLAAALERPEMTPGGMLLVVADTAADEVSSSLEASGMELGWWDNGSIDVTRSRA